MGTSNADTKWSRVCAAEDVFEGTGRRYELDDLPPLAVFNLDGSFVVTDDTCTHGDASLCDGWVTGEEVECPFHAGKFNLRTGEATAYPAERPIRVYRSKVSEGEVLISTDRAHF